MGARKRIEHMLRNMPPHIPKITAEQHKELNAQLAAFDAIEKQMLRDHKSPPMPAKVVYAIESAGPEFMTEAEIQDTVEKYNRAAGNIKQGQNTGGQTLANRSADRKEKVLEKNPELIRKLTTGIWSVNRIATKLHDEWDKRGDGLPRPAIRTLRRWLKVV